MRSHPCSVATTLTRGLGSPRCSDESHGMRLIAIPDGALPLKPPPILTDASSHTFHGGQRSGKAK